MKNIQIYSLVDKINKNEAIDMILNHKNINFFNQYYAEYYGSSFSDMSFYLEHQDKIIAYVLLYKISEKLCWPLDGIKIQTFPIKDDDEKTILNTIVDHIEKISKENLCPEIIIKDHTNGDRISQLGGILFKKRYKAKLDFEMLIDFKGFNEEEYFRNIRKSYKSLINWGKKNLKIKIIDKINPSREEFLNFKNFHHKISGRKTRSDASWDIQYEMVSQGIGELILAYYQGNLVAGSLFMDQNDISIYFTGVYERSLFNFGVSHYLLYYGICRSYKRGTTKSFSLGIFETDIQDPKWYNIQFFKKGFCQNLQPTIFWSQEIKE